MCRILGLVYTQHSSGSSSSELNTSISEVIDAFIKLHSVIHTFHIIVETSVKTVFLVLKIIAVIVMAGVYPLLHLTPTRKVVSTTIGLQHPFIERPLVYS